MCSAREGRMSTICVDANAEAVPGTIARTFPSFVCLMSVECTNSELLCSPYVDGRILSCAVCTISNSFRQYPYSKHSIILYQNPVSSHLLFSSTRIVRLN